MVPITAEVIGRALIAACTAALEVLAEIADEIEEPEPEQLEDSAENTGLWALHPECLLTPTETAELLCSTVQTLNSWRHIGRGPKYRKVGRFVRYRVGELRAYVEAGKR